MVVMGMMILWRYPSIAEKHKVTANDLVIQTMRAASDRRPSLPGRSTTAPRGVTRAGS